VIVQKNFKIYRRQTYQVNALVRVDFNVPLDDQGNITDIASALPFPQSRI